MGVQKEIVLRSLGSFLPQLKKQHSVIFEQVADLIIPGKSEYYYHFAYRIIDPTTGPQLDIGLATLKKQVKKGRVTSYIEESYEEFIREHQFRGHRKIHEGNWKYPF